VPRDLVGVVVELGRDRDDHVACTGASQVGNAPLNDSTITAKNRSIEPNSARWTM
jgi:hypothetical protein